MLLDGHSVLPTGNENLGEVDDPYVNREVATLGRVSTIQLQRGGSDWQRVDEYVARQAYVAVLGYERFPFFVSSRIDTAALVRSPIYGWDLTSLMLK